MFESFLNSIFKQKCVVCGCSKNNQILCKNCLRTVEKLSPYAQRVYEGVQIFSAVKYNDSAKKIVRNLKFHHKKSAANACAELLYEYFEKVCKENMIDKRNLIIAPVPSHIYRVIARGFCHTELIAGEFAHLAGIKSDFKLIKKVKNTIPQYKIKVKNKRKNIKGAYAINPDRYKGNTILVLDDLVTSGATLGEIISEFKKHKIDKIICLTFACV